MKVLTVKNPWGYLICSGVKDIENRSKKTNFRGTILIHTSKVWDSSYRTPFEFFTKKQIESIPSNTLFKIKNLNIPNQAIIGQVEIVDCIKNSRSIWAEYDQFHWVLKNAILYPKPILFVKGSLGLWEYKGI